MTNLDGVEDSRVGMTELLTWVAGLAALAGLIAEVVHRWARDSASAMIGALLVAYVIYFSVSIRGFWRIPRIAIPATMLTGAALWTVALHTIERSDLTRALGSAIFIPVAMMYVVRLLESSDEGDRTADGRKLAPSLAEALLDRGQGFGRGIARRRRNSGRIVESTGRDGCRTGGVAS